MRHVMLPSSCKINLHFCFSDNNTFDWYTFVSFLFDLISFFWPPFSLCFSLSVFVSYFFPLSIQAVISPYYHNVWLWSDNNCQCFIYVTSWRDQMEMTHFKRMSVDRSIKHENTWVLAFLEVFLINHTMSINKKWFAYTTSWLSLFVS